MEKVSTAIILAGGMGLRLRPFTERNPKVMIPVAGKPMAEWQVSWLKHNGIRRLIFAAGYNWEKIKDHFGNITSEGLVADYSIEDEPLGTGGCLRQAITLSQDQTILAVNGDIITDLPVQRMVNFHHEHHTLATLLVVPFVSPYGVVDVLPNGLVKGFVEKPVFPNAWINGGVYLLSKSIMPQLPDKGDVEVTTFPKLVRKGQLAAFRYEGFWRAVDTMKDLQSLDKELSSRRAQGTLKL